MTTLQTIKTWLKTCGFDCTARIGDAWEYDLDEEIIYIPRKIETAPIDEYFVEYLRTLGYKGNYSVVTLSMLHELGHHMTIDEDLMDESEPLKAMLRMSDLDEKEHLFAYWNTPVEYEANMWLVSFVRDYKFLVEKFEKGLDKTA